MYARRDPREPRLPKGTGAFLHEVLYDLFLAGAVSVPLIVRPDISATLPAVATNKQRLKIGKPNVIRPAFTVVRAYSNPMTTLEV